ncbi:hypothetical protein LJC20_02890 [Eubacteriales bacterium OttesenSCG-928-M02]|nr:hypothetical protein [Eubacteriales bacterium OttesenSCG-928-M02]
MQKPFITNARMLAAYVQEVGMLPLFRSSIPGFSLRELTPREYWFQDGVEGPWQWRETLAKEGKIAYGKLFSKKAGFVSMDWYPDLANYRRDGYDFDAKYEDGLISRRCKLIMDVLEREGASLSSTIKRMAGFYKGGEKGFETALTTLQMQTYVTVREFFYNTNKKGEPYGWGIGRYTTSESLFGADVVTSAYARTPAESYRRLFLHVQGLCPHATEAQIKALLG